MAPPTTYASWHASNDVVRSHGKADGNTGAAPGARPSMPPRGPARFYYDKSTYTGTHRSAGPRHGSGQNGLFVGGAAEATTARGEPAPPWADRFGAYAAYPCHTRASSRQRPASARGRACPESSRRPPSPRQTGAATSNLWKACTTPAPEEDMAQTLPAAPWSSTVRPASAGKKPRADPTARTGPERFFYDQASWTGVHRYGGPSTNDSRGIGGEFGETLRPGVTSSGSKAATPKPTFRLRESSSRPRQSSRSRSPSPLPQQETPLPERATSPQAQPMHDASSSARAGLRGPERFYYDQSSWTGVHRYGGPSTTDTHTGIREISDILRPGIDAVSLAKSASPNQATFRPSQLSGRHRDTSQSRSPSRPRDTPASQAAVAAVVSETSPENEATVARPGLPRGPERFFYDQSTYTGVHRHGGPCTIDIRKTAPDQFFRRNLDGPNLWCHPNQRIAV